MRIQRISDKEINVIIPGKGHFNIMIDDWGGDYPGIDIEYISEKGMKDTASKPRVMFELGHTEEDPTVRVWEDPNNEDHTYDFTFDIGKYES